MTDRGQLLFQGLGFMLELNACKDFGPSKWRVTTGRMTGPVLLMMTGILIDKVTDKVKHMTGLR